jgi:hypothetical protein
VDNFAIVWTIIKGWEEEHEEDLQIIYLTGKARKA